MQYQSNKHTVHLANRLPVRSQPYIVSRSDEGVGILTTLRAIEIPWRVISALPVIAAVAYVVVRLSAMVPQ